MSEMEGGKWEDLSMDCLVNVFGRVGIESLLLDVPFMCKSWYKATLNPLCWRRLDFSKISLDSWSYDESISRLLDKYQLNDKLSVTAFIKFVVKRSARSATFLSLPDCCTEEALLYVADECPDLRVLLLPRCLPRDHMLQIPNLMSKWKNLELLRLGGTFHLQEILAQINIHCKNFIGLGIPRAYIKRDEASAIVTLLPNIKQLFLRHASMEKENLVMILQGCKELKYFDVRDCIGFDEGDDEILKLASHIQTFEHKGSMLYDYYDDYRPSYRDDGFHDGGVSD
ncbi:F-box/LRR-repeat protein At3g48880-like [Camellia sinensis]|uniref:F-box/LRR-repeat protein At3g48880-like n=1 Tax=Camellia sinensis TaxID=4442 RepID=UPI0010367FCF|nr:F-box/LRR-repeat protein At3g48880-like [Camellia sinensis]